MAHDPSAYGDAFADVYDDWYSDDDPADADAAVARLVALASDGRALELGVGTGRLAIPLAAAGVKVHGVEASREMLRRLAARDRAGSVRVIRGDMADLTLPGSPRFSLVFVAYNTICNLVSEDAQRRCVDGAARALAPGGRFVVEAFVPADDVGDARVIDVVERAGSVVFRVSQSDARTQQVEGRHVEVRPDGRVRVRPWRIRYISPEQLDDLASGAGLTLESRHAGWRGEPFDERSTRHVSVWRRR